MTYSLQDRIAKLRKLEAKATPGPWTNEALSTHIGQIPEILTEETSDGDYPNLINCELIAALRNDALAIIDELRAEKLREQGARGGGGFRRVECEDCAAFDQEDNSCRRYPPKYMLSVQGGVWPGVHGEDWCYEGIRKEGHEQS